MQEEKIQELKAYDWEEFKRERVFCAHNPVLSEGSGRYGGRDGAGDAELDI